MRNIKLRGKSIKLGEWIYGNSFCSPEDEGVLSDNPLIKKDGVWVEVDKDTLSTYIGINDTLNNNKIYEGDIVKIYFADFDGEEHFDNNIVGEVVYEFAQYQIRYKRRLNIKPTDIRGNPIGFIQIGGVNTHDEFNCLCTYEYERELKIEKLGNKYDSPELLKQITCREY